MKKAFVLLTLILTLMTSCSLHDSSDTSNNPSKTPKDSEERLIRYLALGDSYTIGESVPSRENFPNQLVDSLQARGIEVAESKIIATTGWRTDQLWDAILQDDPGNDWNLVSLLIGVNNQYQGKDIETYEKEFEELLTKSIALAGGDASRVFVVSIPDYAYTPFGQRMDPEKISRELDEYNSINRRISEGYGVDWVQITDISRRGLEDTSLVASDGLHPSGAQYTQWVTRIMQGFR